MSDEGNQLSCVYLAHQEMEAIDITAMLALDDSYIITAERKTRRLQLYNQQLDVESQYQLEKAGWYGVIDLTQVQHLEFAGLVPGIFWGSEVRVYFIAKYNQINLKYHIKVDRRSYGLSFQKNFFFVATSPQLIHLYGKPAPGYIEMFNEKGKVKHTFDVDKDNKPLFSRHISKVHVTEKFTMYVCDSGKKELLILQVEAFNYAVTILTSHKYDVIHFSRMKDSSCFLATNNRDGVVLLHANGKWVYNNFLSVEKLNGHPKGIACLERDQQRKLMVVVQKSKWLPRPKTWLELFTYSLEYQPQADTCIQMES